MPRKIIRTPGKKPYAAFKALLADFEPRLEAIRDADELSKVAKIKAFNALETKIIRGLQPQHIRFCEEFQKDFNVMQAGLRAGFKEDYLRSSISGIMNVTGIREYLYLIREKAALQVHITKEFVLNEFDKLARIKCSDLYDEDGNLIPPHKLPAHIAAAVCEVKQKTTSLLSGTVQVEFTYRLHSKVAALDALGKHTGIYERDNKQKGASTEAGVVFYLPQNGREVKQPLKKEA